MLHRLEAQIDTLSQQLINQVTHHAAQVFAVAEHIHRFWRQRILMHFSKHGFQRIKHGRLAFKMQGTHFLPRVAIHQIDTAD
ncbi:Uncharacterised protein [Vibrio cholerae]|nr:Uncharacterised protein [Vibrio cholerae]CSC85979.1 Uncharacterised protein [Vibrio cholerae]CSI60340.1 Uncharacterised protein [Vibrio cholerae]